MEPILGPVEALLLADATARFRDENARYDLVQLRLRRDAQHSFAIATDTKYMVLARWNNGGEECDFGVDGESIRQLLRATDEDTVPDEDGPSGLRSRVGGFRAESNSLTLLAHIGGNDLLTVSTPGYRKSGRFPDVNSLMGWLFNPTAPPSDRPQPDFCPILLTKVFSVFSAVAGGRIDGRPRVRHFLHDGHKVSVGCWEMTFGTDRLDGLTAWGLLMPLVK